MTFVPAQSVFGNDRHLWITAGSEAGLEDISLARVGSEVDL